MKYHTPLPCPRCGMPCYTSKMLKHHHCSTYQRNGRTPKPMAK
jgi:hypothetical protein